MTQRADRLAPTPISRRACDAGRILLLVAMFSLVAACGGGGDGGSDNSRPVASFSVSTAGGQVPLTVTFDGTFSTDSDGSITSYAWNFGDNSTGSGATATHTYTTTGTFNATLTVTDNDGATNQASRSITVTSGPPPPTVKVSGTALYEFVPFHVDPSKGLDYSNITNQPIRGAVIELIGTGQAVLATTTTNDAGVYELTAEPNRDAFVRVKAQVKRDGSPGWNVSVKNNTNSNALYVMDGTAFNTGIVDQTRPTMVADSGWPGFGGTSYSGPRVAAPFAILDSMYTAVRFVVGNGDPALSLPALDTFWAPQNKGSDTWNPTIGNIVSTRYLVSAVGGFPPGIYVQGLQNNDTDEYDRHVLVHEFQHFLEAAISRTESPGLSHNLVDKLDMRLAFSEGFANAFSAMVLGNTLYSDSLGSSQGQRFSFDVESNASPAGWFNEASNYSLAFDLYDANRDGADNVALGYGPIFDAFRNELRTGPAQTSLYPFVAALKSRVPASAAAIDTLVESQSVFGVGVYGAGETTDGGITEALPVYTELTVNGGAKKVCGTNEAATTLVPGYNRLGNRVFLRFSLASGRTVTIQSVYTSNGSDPSTIAADPDFKLYRGAYLTTAEGEGTTETLSLPLEAGDYVIEAYDWSHADPDVNRGISERRGVTCMNVSVN